MLALSGEEPIAVVTGCKRPEETLIYKIGVHPEFQRQGHASHLLTSLSHKLSVLGPPELTVEIPLADFDDAESASQAIVPFTETAILQFFRKLGYEQCALLSDFVLKEPLSGLGHNECTGAVPLSSVFTDELFGEERGIAWERARASLEHVKGKLSALAFVSPGAVEAAVIYGERSGIEQIHVRRFLVRDTAMKQVFYAILLRELHSLMQKCLFIPKLAENELEYSLLEQLGFRRTRAFVKLRSRAHAA